MSRRSRVIESESGSEYETEQTEEETEDESEDIEEIEDSQSATPLRRTSSRLRRRVITQNETDSDSENESDDQQTTNTYNRNRNNNHNRNRNRNRNTNRNRNNNNDNKESESESELDEEQTQQRYNEAKNDIEGANDISSDDNDNNSNDESDVDELLQQTYPNYASIIPQEIHKFDKHFDKIDEDIEELALPALIDTAQSLAEYNSHQNNYRQQSQRLQNAMNKLLNLSKDFKIEKLMLNRVSDEIRTEHKFDDDDNPIKTGNWSAYLDRSRDNVIHEIESKEEGRDHSSKRIKQFIANKMTTYNEQFRDAIELDEIEEFDNRNRNRNRNNNNNGSDDDEEDMDIVIDRSNRNAGPIKCPLTTVAIIKPVKSKLCLHTFEKDAVFKYIRQKAPNARCPLPGCQKILTIENMIRDITAEKAIKAQNKHEQNNDSEDDDDAMFDLTVPN